MTTRFETWPGQPHPLGASWDGVGTNFSVFSSAAERLELCLFDDAGAESRVELTEVEGHCWHAYLPEARPGQRYGYRVHGAWDPATGRRCNPQKLLLDPYARAIEGDVAWHPAVYGFRGGEPDGPPDAQDSAPYVPRSIVVSPYFDWGVDRPPRVPWQDTIVYELHVKGFTKLHPGVPEHLRGSYAGLAHPAAIEHLLKLGVTTVELMPVHQFVHEEFLTKRGLVNYWGYATLGFFAPHAAYASRTVRGSQVAEFKQMVKALHEAGIEVILDVVYNHTGEGNHLGPNLCFRGLDNAAYYRLDADDPSRYADFTGCGNTLDPAHPHVLQLIMDSLRYWVQEMHVDGFRFDLAAALVRGEGGDEFSAFLDVVQQDPIVSRVKLVAEPWDLGEDGYKVGRFPPLWSEWNGKYRDTVRDFWRGAEGTVGDLARRLTGSSDLYETTGRRPHASVNFVTCHDGFPLRDLVSYDVKHNEANGEANRDGESHNRSWNCGVEGPTDDPAVTALRARQVRNFLATLMLSQGVPLFAAGDEMGRTQSGNNNAYCHDGPLSWLDWAHRDRRLVEFARKLIGLRRAHPVLRRRFFFDGDPGRANLPDIGWYRPDGEPMTPGDWSVPWARSIGVYLNGEAIPGRDARGRPIADDCFYVVLHAWGEALDYVVPHGLDGPWHVAVDTAELERADAVLEPGSHLRVEGRSVVVLVRARRRSSSPPPG